MSNYQQQQDEYGQQHSIQSGFNASGLSMEESVSPMYSVQQQQYPTPGSYYSPPQHNSDMYSQGQAGYTGMDQGSFPTDGTQGGSDIDPGSMGQMASSASSGGYGGGGGADEYGESGFEEELPLLVELGIDFNMIKQKTVSVLNPLQQTDPRTTNDTDLAGPLIFCLLFGVVLLMSGKVHFGYIYGFGLLGCTSLFAVLNLMSTVWVSVTTVVSVLGYCLLPMVLLSCFSLLVHLQGIVGVLLSLAVICWSSYSASKLFVSILAMNSMQLLVAYPCALLYGFFALLTVF